MDNMGLCLKLAPAISDVDNTESSFDAILSRMLELEKANLRATFSPPSYRIGDDRENAEFTSRIKQILSRAEAEMHEAIQNLLPLTKKYRQQRDTASKVNLEKLCEPYSDKFNNPKGALEDLFAKQLVYRPIKLTDYRTDGIFILQDLAYEYVNEIKRQLGELWRFENDKTELITLLYESVPKFLDEEMKEFQKSVTTMGLQIFTENINVFAMQRFQFYRDVQVSGVPQPLLNGGGQPNKLPLEKYFEAAINVLEKKKDKHFPFKLLGSHKMSDFIAVIRANKAKSVKGVKTEQAIEDAYNALYDQIIFAVSPISLA